METSSNHNSDGENTDFTLRELAGKIEFMETSSSHNPLGENISLSRSRSKDGTEVTLVMQSTAINVLKDLAQEEGENSSYENLATHLPERAYELARQAIKSMWLGTDSDTLAFIEVDATTLYTDSGDPSLASENPLTMVKTILDDYLPARYKLPSDFTLKIDLEATDDDKTLFGPDSNSFNVYSIGLKR